MSYSTNTVALPSCILTRRWSSSASISFTSSLSTVKVSRRSQITRFASSFAASSIAFWISSLFMLATPRYGIGIFELPAYSTLETRPGRRGPLLRLQCPPDARDDGRRILKGLARRVRDLDRATFRAVFGLKWAPLTSVLRLFTGFEPAALIVPWAAVAGSWTFAEGTKYLFDRARPFMWDTGVAPLIKTPSSSSFPSGHSATAAAGA